MNRRGMIADLLKWIFVLTGLGLLLYSRFGADVSHTRPLAGTGIILLSAAFFMDILKALYSGVAAISYGNDQISRHRQPFVFGGVLVIQMLLSLFGVGLGVFVGFY